MGDVAVSRTFYIYFHKPVFDAVFLAGPYRLFWMLLLVHVGGVCFDALQAVLMRCSATLTQWPCTQKALMVYKAIFPLLWAWLYTTSAGTPRGPRPAPLNNDKLADKKKIVFSIGCKINPYSITLKTKKVYKNQCCIVFFATDSK